MVMAALSHSYSWPRDDTLLINDDELESFIAEELLQPASQDDTTQDDSMGAVDPLDSTLSTPAPVSAPAPVSTPASAFSSPTSMSMSPATIVDAPAPAPTPAVSARDVTSQNNPPASAPASLSATNDQKGFAGVHAKSVSEPEPPARLPVPTDSLNDSNMFSPDYPTPFSPLDSDLTNTELTDFVDDMLCDFLDEGYTHVNVCTL